MKKYGVEVVDRPKIRPIKELDLTGKEGEEIIKLLTKKILIRHEKTFKPNKTDKHSKHNNKHNREKLS